MGSPSVPGATALGRVNHVAASCQFRVGRQNEDRASGVFNPADSIFMRMIKCTCTWFASLCQLLAAGAGERTQSRNVTGTPRDVEVVGYFRVKAHYPVKLGDMLLARCHDVCSSLVVE